MILCDGQNQIAYVNTFLEECKNRGLSSNTLKVYRLNLNQFCNFLKKNDGSFTKDSVMAFVSYLQKQCKQSSINQKISTLRTFLDYLVEQQVLRENPVKVLNIKQCKQPVSFTTVGMDVITAVVKQAYNEKAFADPGMYSYRAVLRDIAVLELLFISGMRVSELCSLSPYDVNLKEKMVHIKGPGNKQRTLRIESEATLKALSAYKYEFWPQMVASNQYFVNRLGRGLTTQSVRNMVKRYAKDAHVEQLFTPKVLRNSIATALAEDGCDLISLQYMLGNNSITQTQRYVRGERKILSADYLRNRLEENEG